MSQIRVALLYGGKSSEHEISLVSAASILQNLSPEKYEVIPVGMGKDGTLYINDYKTLLHGHKESLPVCATNARSIESLLKDGNFSIDVDVVFPVVHGPLYEDGALQGILKHANIPFVGNDILSSSIGMDKDMTRRVAGLAGAEGGRYYLLPWHVQNQALQEVMEALPGMLGGWPLFVKPCTLGSSVGIHKVSNLEELKSAINDARYYDDEIMIEEFIKGREIELAVLDNINNPSKPKVSIPGEIKVNHKDGFYSYVAKYIESDATEICVPAVTSPETTQRLQEMASEIFLSLKCRGMARVDFFLTDNDKIYFNEINTIPGFTSISMYPRLFEASGTSYEELLSELVELGIFYHRRRNRLITHYK